MQEPRPVSIVVTKGKPDEISEKVARLPDVDWPMPSEPSAQTLQEASRTILDGLFVSLVRFYRLPGFERVELNYMAKYNFIRTIFRERNLYFNSLLVVY